MIGYWIKVFVFFDKNFFSSKSLNKTIGQLIKKKKKKNHMIDYWIKVFVFLIKKIFSSKSLNKTIGQPIKKTKKP